MQTVYETAHVGYVATDAGIQVCAASYRLPEALTDRDADPAEVAFGADAFAVAEATT